MMLGSSNNPAEEDRENCEARNPETVDVDCGGLSLDDVFVALGHSRRRYTVETLASQPKLAIQDLAEDIVAIEATATPSGIRAPTHERVQTSLYHHHLPKLETFEALTFDRESRRIERSEFTGQMIEFLDAVNSAVDDW